MPGCVLTPDPSDLLMSPRLTCVRVSSGDHPPVFMILTTLWSLISGHRGLSVVTRFQADISPILLTLLASVRMFETLSSNLN